MAVTATALMAPSAGVAAPTAPRAGGADVVEVRGTVRVLAGEGGQPDTYSVETRDGRVIRLADGFEADPGSAFSGDLVVPGGTAGGGLTTSARRSAALDRAERRPDGVTARDVRVVSPRPAAGPAAHATYLVKLTNLGAFSVPDADLVAQVNAAQQYWVRESAGVIPAWSTVTGMAVADSAAASVAGGCGLGAGGAQFDAIYRDVAARVYPGVDFTGDSPNHLVIVVPSACFFDEAVGRARRGVSLNSGGPVIVLERGNGGMQSTLEHEYGHNVGLQHSTNARAEYGGLYELMGSDPAGHTSPVLGTVFRWEQGVVAAGEYADASNGLGATAIGSRTAATGLRSVVFIDPDTGKRTFVDYRDGAGADAGAFYAKGLGAVASYGQSYAKGLVLERENEERGSFLLDVQGGDGALQAGESWSNASGSIVVAATGANTVQVTRTQKPPLPAGSASVAGTAEPLRTVSAGGAVAGATAYRYQWLFNGQPVPQADDPTFAPTVAMAGGQLSVQVTGYAVGRNPSPTATSAPVTVQPASWYRREGTTGVVSISGSPRVGRTLTASGLDWVNYLGTKPGDYSTTYVWSRNGKTIKGASASTYRLTAKDLGKRIQVREYPRAAGYATSSYVRSSTTRKVRIGTLVTKRPKITGKAKVGKRLVARAKGWTNATRFSYQWFVGKKAIRGATSKKLAVTRGLKGKKVSVKVTGKKKGFKKASSKSRPKKIK
ncbi:hypothetical protein [Nocardioides cavernae]|uniref:hypothetical protein n=1 Tax=Nocardioides cavernae TaxID=1921566 RepID=UPI0015CED775|nr:hypothetical protein [Nocardioides cavernae]